MKYRYRITEFLTKEIDVEADDPVIGQRKLLEEYKDDKHNLDRLRHYGGLRISCIREVE